MNTPLLGIRIKDSDHPALRAGHQFDTVADFDATVRAVRDRLPAGRVSFVVTWRDRATFHGVYDLERAESLVEHVTRVCCDVLAEPRLEPLLGGVRLTLLRLFSAALAERCAGLSRPFEPREAPCPA